MEPQKLKVLSFIHGWETKFGAMPNFMDKDAFDSGREAGKKARRAAYQSACETYGATLHEPKDILRRSKDVKHYETAARENWEKCEGCQALAEELQ